MKKSIVILTMLALIGQLHAKSYSSQNGFITVVLNDNPIPGYPIAISPDQLFGLMIPDLITQVDTMLPSSLLDSINGTLGHMADAQSASTRGLGTTYATNHELFVLSASVNAGASTGDSSIIDIINNPAGLLPTLSPGSLVLPQLGAGIQTSIKAGLSLKIFNIKPLGFFDLSRLSVFANFFTWSSASSPVPLEIPIPAEIKTDSMGIHVQYKIFPDASIAASSLHWGGLDITTGLDITSNSLIVGLDQIVPDMSGAGGINMTMGDMSFISQAVTVPIELSTSVRLGYILTLIAGGGVDINMGESSFNVDPIGLTMTTPDGSQLDLGRIEFAKQRKGATFADVRAFIGPQINLIPLAKGKNLMSLTILASISTVNLYGVHIGFNIGF